MLSLLFIALTALAKLAPVEQVIESPTNDPYVSYQWPISWNNQVSIRDVDDIHLEHLAVLKDKGINWRNVDEWMQRDVRLAIVDSGIDRHEDLAGNLMEGGKSFVEKDENMSPLFDDEEGHGTHVASIAAAVSNNNTGITGLSNRIKILPLKVYTTADDEIKNAKKRNSLPERVALAIEYAIQKKVDVISLSMGWTEVNNTKEVQQVFKKAIDRGIIIVAAAGNDDNDGQIYPCSSPNVVCVGSTDVDGEKSDFSNHGGHIDIFAPGNDILGAIPSVKPSSFFGPKGYDYMSGTSQSTPLVAATLAILRGIYPLEESQKLIFRLLNSTTPFGEHGQGRLNFLAALSPHTGEVQPRPNFKGLQFYEVSENNLEINLFIPWFQGLTHLPSVNIQASYPVSSSQITQDGLQIKLRPSSLQDDSHAWIKVKINGRIFKHSFFIVQKIKKSPTFLPNPTQVPINYISSFLNKGTTRSVEFWSVDFSAKEGARDNDSLSIHFWQLINGTYVHQVKQFSQINWIQPAYQPVRIDWNMDGVDEYIVPGFKLYSKKDSEIHYLYLNSNFDVIYDFKLLPDPDGEMIFPVLSSAKDYQFIVSRYQGGDILTPAFWGAGGISWEDRIKASSGEPSFFAFEDKRTNRRLYYFSPKMNNNTEGFAQRTATSNLLEKKLRKKLNLDVTSDIIWLGSLQQKSMRQLSLLVSIGRGIKSDYFVLHLPEEKLVPLQNSQGLELQRNGLDDGWRIDTNKKVFVFDQLNVFYSFIAGRVLSLIDDRIASIQNIQRPRTSEKLAATTKSFLDEANQLLTFFITSDGIRAIGKWRGQDIDKKQTLYRSTFLPGLATMQRIFPMIVGENQSPGYLVDNTRIYNETLIIYELKERGGLLSTIERSYKVPVGCFRMNEFLGDRDYHLIPVLCPDTSQLRLFLLE